MSKYVNASIAKQRKVNDYPKTENYGEFDQWEKIIVDYLIENKPEIKHDTFIHGDFHYGNVLWDNKEISGVIDWEYAGVGFKEQDIAWALILRSTQKFLYSIEEIETFLEGYNRIGNYDKKKLNWCLINGYMHFYLMNKKNGDEIYLNRLKNLISLVENSLIF